MANQTDKKLRVLFASAEAAPLAKVGGLADVAGTLPQTILALNEENVDIRLIIPFHADIKKLNPSHRLVGNFDFIRNGVKIICDLFVSQIGELPVYLVDSEHINHNSPVYHRDWYLDGMKYSVFSIALLEAAKYLNWKFDILHANDWHTALSVYALKTIYAEDRFFNQTKAILSIHNLPFNGWGSQDAMTLLGIPTSQDKDLPEWARYTPLPMGLSAADRIIAVSPGYADEILTPDYGCGLDEYLAIKPDRLTGIINGIDYTQWDPQTDQTLPYRYSIDNLTERIKNKIELQSALNFNIDPDVPLLTVVSRLDRQKGIQHLFEALPLMVDEKWQAVILGTGDPNLESQAKQLAAIYPNRFSALLKYDDVLARMLYASGDIFIMPSLYEPCGLSQMIAMRYGNIPLASATGGLRDTIVDYISDKEKGTGFLLAEKSVNGLVNLLPIILRLYKNKDEWLSLQQNAMTAKFSWDSSAVRYIREYRKLLVTK